MPMGEPSAVQVWIALAVGQTIASPIYKSYVQQFNLQGNERVLDFGSGSGVLARFLAQRLLEGSGHVTCVDVSRVWIETAQRTLRRFPNVDFKFGDIAALDLAVASFDAVNIHFVLHEVDASARPEIVRQLVRCLKPGGKVFMREPTGRGLSSGEARSIMKENGAKLVAFDIAHSRLLGETYDAVFQLDL